MGTRNNGNFGNTKGADISVSEQKMHQDGKHFNKHGRNMRYNSKS